MKTIRFALAAVALFGLCFTAGAVQAQDYGQDYREPGNYDDYGQQDKGEIDRYLDAEVWTDHADAEYYTGDEVVVHFRTNRDAFVAIYSIDSRGMVNLLFPSDPAQDNFIRGGLTYSLPGADDNFELVLNGPEGSESIQIIASRERFSIPSWYRNSGLVFEGDDIYDYMDYLNSRYFVRYGGQRFAYDRAVIFVNEWEDDYFRPVYYTDYPSWSVVGNVYLDYPYGSTVYINGYYWGVTPLYIPRILVGWHTLSIYDSYGYGWENDFHVSRYHTTIFDRNVIVTSPGMRSKYKRVRSVGYRDPVSNGYANYNKKVVSLKTRGTSVRGKVASKGTTGSRSSDVNYTPAKKRYVRGDSKVVKTERGYETRSATTKTRSGSDSGMRTYNSSKGKTRTQTGSSGNYDSGSSRSSKSSGKSGNYSGSSRSSSGKTKSSGSGNYYKRKSGSSSSMAKQGSSSGTYKRKGKVSKGSSSGKYKSSGKRSTVKQSRGKGSGQKVSKSSGSRSSSSKSVGTKRSSGSSRSSRGSSGHRSSSTSRGKSKR